MAGYILGWCEKCGDSTWQTCTDYEGNTCASGRHPMSESYELKAAAQMEASKKALCAEIWAWENGENDGRHPPWVGNLADHLIAAGYRSND